MLASLILEDFFEIDDIVGGITHIIYFIRIRNRLLLLRLLLLEYLVYVLVIPFWYMANKRPINRIVFYTLVTLISLALATAGTVSEFKFDALASLGLHSQKMLVWHRSGIEFFVDGFDFVRVLDRHVGRVRSALVRLPDRVAVGLWLAPRRDVFPPFIWRAADVLPRDSAEAFRALLRELQVMAVMASMASTVGST